MSSKSNDVKKDIRAEKTCKRCFISIVTKTF